MATHKRSEVWNFFKLLEQEKKTKCDLCGACLSYNSNSTKSMWNHLRALHGSAIAGSPSNPTSAGNSSQTVSQKFGRQTTLLFDVKRSSQFDQAKSERCYRKAAIVCAADLRPFSMFSTPAFKR